MKKSRNGKAKAHPAELLARAVPEAQAAEQAVVETARKARFAKTNYKAARKAHKQAKKAAKRAAKLARKALKKVAQLKLAIQRAEKVARNRKAAAAKNQRKKPVLSQTATSEPPSVSAGQPLPAVPEAAPAKQTPE